jgi:hypothetical protein
MDEVPIYRDVQSFCHVPDVVAFPSKVSVIRPPITGNLVDGKLGISGDVEGSVLLNILRTYLEGRFCTFVLSLVVGESPKAGLLGVEADETFGIDPIYCHAVRSGSGVPS